MKRVLLFAGTTEGRALANALKDRGVPTLALVTTDYGETLLPAGGSLEVRAGRLDEAALAALIREETPTRVIDATHPYAARISESLRGICAAREIPLIRVLRESSPESGALTFPDLVKLVVWLNTTEGVIFSTLGSKEAKALTGVCGYQERVVLRILPTVESVKACLDAGYSPKQLICMQGPFTQELNAALFRETRAKILVTKETGSAGGYREKLAAARDCGMAAAVLARPYEGCGLSLAALLQRIKEGNL